MFGTDRGPERARRFIGLEDKQMTLGNARRAQSLQGLADQPASQPPMARALIDGQVVDQAASAIVTDQDRGNEGTLVQGDQTEARIAREEAPDLDPAIGAAQADPWRSDPERSRGIVVTRVERLDFAHPERLPRLHRLRPGARRDPPAASHRQGQRRPGSP